MDRTLPRGITVKKHRSGKGTIYVSFTYRGVKCRESTNLAPTNRNIKYAGNLLGEILNSISRQTFSFSEYFPNSTTNAGKLFGKKRNNITIKELFDSIKWENVAPKKTTAYTYNKDSKWAKEELGHIPVEQITTRDIRAWIETMANLKRKSITNRMTPLRIALAIAVANGIIDISPADLVSLGKSSKGLISPEQRKSDYIVDPFSLKEIKDFLTAAEAYDIKAKNYFQFAFFSGLRPSELKGLKWINSDGKPNIDFENRTVRVNEALVNVGGKAFTQTPKTESSNRIVYLLPMAYQALLNQKKVTKNTSDYVFTRFDIKNCNEPMSHNDSYNRPWAKIIKNAGIKHRGAKQTRHSYASQMLSGGENPAFIASQLGHEDLEMVYNVYAKWINNQASTKFQFTAEFGKVEF